MEKVFRNRYPGVLWLLPVFFGLIGGIIAAMFASIKYQAEWWDLFLIGLLFSIAYAAGMVVLYNHYWLSLW